MIPFKYVLGFAREEDISEILEAESLCFPDDPWGISSVTAMLKDENTGFVLWHPVEDTKKIAGYIVYSKSSFLELYKIAVVPKHRRKGLGSKMMEQLLRLGKGTEEKRIILEVRKSNTPAMALYEKYGFKVDGVRKNYYKNPTENGILMSLDLNERQ